MSTDSESHDSRNSATYSIRSLDEVPIRRSAVQIIRERSTDSIQPGSPRKKGTMQITKLVLKDPPTSPKRKPPSMVIKSIQTFTSSAAITENGHVLQHHKHSLSVEDEAKPATQGEGYRILPLPQTSSSRLKEEFEAKKNERNQASSEFQNYLLESIQKENVTKAAFEISKATSMSSGDSIQKNITENNKSDSSTKNASNSNSNSDKPSSTKSVTASEIGQMSEESKPSDMPKELVEPIVQKRPSRPKTTDSRKSTSEPKKEKEKSYDPQKAREFIKEQQAKRKQDKKALGPQTNKKELIKKRLDDLKKNTQVLVSKNVQKARKRSLSASGTGSQKSGAAPVKVAERSKTPPVKPLRKSVSTSSLQPAPAPNTAKSDSGKSSVNSKESKRRSSLLKANLTEKMGIMRKPDEVALEEVMMSPLRLKTPPNPAQQPAVKSPSKHLEQDRDESIEISPEKRVSVLEEELKLKVPEITLVPDSTMKPLQVTPPPDKKEFRPVPPWLKHTLLQPDPYPFIMAVRKKLEAIRGMNPNQTARPNESIIPKKIEETVPRRSKTTNSQKCIDYLETLKSVPYVNKPSSEIEQNISSVLLHHSDSNTTSEISSIKSDFALPLPPLSSTKFDTTHAATRESIRPELTGPISPLSVDRISNLKITANSSAFDRSINVHRGDHMPNAELIPDRVSFNNRNVHPENLRQSQLSLNTSEKQQHFLQKPTEKTIKELEYQKMLEAFNRSLTQVIEVNQQLYSALKKPVDSVPMERIKIRDEMTQTTPVPSIVANASGNSNYSEDFERSNDSKLPSNQHPPDSTQSTPEKSSISIATTTSSSSTGPLSSTSPEESPTGKTQSSESQSQLLDSKSLSLSDSHNTNPPMPEEYLPSFEESLRQKQQLLSNSTEAANKIEIRIEPAHSSTSIETQISDEAPVASTTLRDTLDHSKSLESISMLISERSEALNDQSPKEQYEMEILKAAYSSSADDSELEAIEMATKATGIGNDTTMGSDIMAVFNRTDMELSVMSTTISETNLSYSTIGLYDQLIQSEKCKGDQLAAHARLKEKALLNRTKGQLAWLELQKQRYRERGMLEQISVIKKKQRAILMRLEKERADLNKFKKFTPDVSSRSTVRSPMTPKSLEKLNSFSSHNSNQISLRKSSSGSGKSDQRNASLLGASPTPARNSDLMSQNRMVTRTTTTTISNAQLQLMMTTGAVRGMELQPSDSLENILQRREEELQKRRHHVQTLLEWHQKLDREEQEILDIERNLLQYNQRKIAESQVADEHTLNRIRSIEKSLKTLQQIPETKSSDNDDDEVHASGNRLNRLWHRLTGVKESRYEPGGRYTLTKANLESLYEDAKQRVLEGFRQNSSMRKALLEQSTSGMNSSGSAAERNMSGIGDLKNVSAEHIHTSIDSSEGSSFQTTVNSAELIHKTSQIVNMAKEEVETETKDDSENDERSSLIDVEEIISRVSDITDNINGFLSSTTNIDELLQHEEQQKHQSTSVEFHTIEEEQDSGSHPKLSSDTYSVTFDIPTIEDNRIALSAEDSQLLIEDTSLPPMMNDDSLLNEETISDSMADSIEKVSEDIPDNVSLEEASSSTATTPTTAEETETECNDTPVEGASKDSTTSDLEKRLITLNENLGDLNAGFERVSVIRSPEVPKVDRQQSPESEIITSSIVEEEYSTDMDFVAEELSMDKNSFLDDTTALKSKDLPLAGEIVESHKIEIKIRNKNVNENFPHSSTVNVPSTSGVSSFSYLTPPAHGPSNSTQASVIPNRMPDIINEAEVLRRQQLQIEQEIKQLEQQVVFFREIPNKPPPPYIPPANGSPLALIFPPESRINDLIETRTKELYFDEPTQEKLQADNVTNIYEKLILDMCKELYTDVRSPKEDVSFRTVKLEKRPLTFYNPPDRLICVQNYMKQKIKRILNEDFLLQQQQQQLNLHHCPVPFLMFAGSSAKRKRDQVDEILAQEMFDEEARWTNFDREEIEVKERIVGEVTKLLVADAFKDMEEAWKEKNGNSGESGSNSTLVEELVEE
ncbi:centrosome-associated protein 350-like [Armigeres subalbatus]|uniref:centrosome-associated protein 350-like n=1 Tax=Armigeres subalbatus TaxID=124917 RepID=UPI002ED3557A